MEERVPFGTLSFWTGLVELVGTMEGWLSKTELHENPLVPNKKMRQMYTAMAEARALDDYIVKLKRTAKGRSRLDSTRGQEALRVSTTIDLEPGDLVSDSQRGVVMELLLGEKVNSLLQRAVQLCSGKKVKETKWAWASGRLLPWIDEAGERLRLAMGAALSFKALGRRNVVIAYVSRESLSKKDWPRFLSLASKLELPLIFVVLPSTERIGKRKAANLSDDARRSGVPGIPVDAGDAVALYRVAQESMGRIRGGDGPVLIECRQFASPGEDGIRPADPLLQLRRFLLRRKICKDVWLKNAGKDFRRRIEGAKR
jgi:acetoin:2,6-dichlorophenolindophenol oxidoreductase subunit alpha